MGSAGTTFMTDSTESPHIAFNVGPDTLLKMEEWLTARGVPRSDFRTRRGIETPMIFRDRAATESRSISTR